MMIVNIQSFATALDQLYPDPQIAPIGIPGLKPGRWGANTLVEIFKTGYDTPLCAGYTVQLHMDQQSTS